MKNLARGLRPVAPSAKVAFRVPTEIHRRLMVEVGLAKARGRNKSDLLNDFVREGLERLAATRKGA